jgi:Cation transport ATPase (P-type)
MRSRAQLRLQIREARTSDIVEVYAFTSAKKMASVLLRTDEPGRLRLYNKGAAEWVLQRCSGVQNQSGEVTAMTEAIREELMQARPVPWHACGHATSFGGVVFDDCLLLCIPPACPLPVWLPPCLPSAHLSVVVQSLPALSSLTHLQQRALLPPDGTTSTLSL